MSSFTWWIVNKWQAYPNKEERKYLKEEDALEWAKQDNSLWDVITVKKEVTETIDIITILAQDNGEGRARDYNKEFLLNANKR